MHQSAQSNPTRRPPAKRWFVINLAIALFLILAGIGSLIWMGQQTTAQKSGAPAAKLANKAQGQTAPDFTLFNPAGQPVSLSDYAGQVVLVNHWATWCPPCKAEMPDLNRFYETYRARGVVVLAVNSQENAATVNQFITANGFTFPVLLDSEGEVMARYNVRGLPTTFIIDRSGAIHFIRSGAVTYQELEKIVQPLL